MGIETCTQITFRSTNITLAWAFSKTFIIFYIDYGNFNVYGSNTKAILSL